MLYEIHSSFGCVPRLARRSGVGCEDWGPVVQVLAGEETGWRVCVLADLLQVYQWLLMCIDWVSPQKVLAALDLGWLTISYWILDRLKQRKWQELLLP